MNDEITLQPSFPDLRGKVAVVTGGSRGIGAETCRVLARNGVRVAVVGRDRSAIDGVVGDIQGSGGDATGIATDCTDERALLDLRHRVEQEFGAADILMPFAGGDGMPVPTLEMSRERWQQVLDSELTSVFLSFKTFLPPMIERRHGAVVTMSSSAGRAVAGSSAVYAVAKTGVIALTRQMATEVARHHIRINCIAPSAIENDRMRQAMTREQIDQLGASFPLGRIGQPIDTALAAAFLASDASSWITGATLDISGGRIMV